MNRLTSNGFGWSTGSVAITVISAAIFVLVHIAGQGGTMSKPGSPIQVQAGMCAVGRGRAARVGVLGTWGGCRPDPCRAGIIIMILTAIIT